ncbi:unnamed protein product [Schistocephalus solidus]|uniref:Reverse transcriptase domain-containing protein n=1 Tax=Schistocephalus solidus TaxID=70667 RepID=A0A3P7E0J5_SCHSO|nr:unnamed protein product [Schistocephalus solidus]
MPRPNICYDISIVASDKIYRETLGVISTTVACSAREKSEQPVYVYHTQTGLRDMHQAFKWVRGQSDTSGTSPEATTQGPGMSGGIIPGRIRIQQQTDMEESRSLISAKVARRIRCTQSSVPIRSHVLPSGMNPSRCVTAYLRTLVNVIFMCLIPRSLKYSVETAEVEVVELLHLLLVDRPRLRSIQQRRQYDNFVQLEFGAVGDISAQFAGRDGCAGCGSWEEPNFEEPHVHVLSISLPDENIVQQLPAPRTRVHPRGLLPRWKAEEGVGQLETVFRTRSQKKEAVIVTATETVGTQHSLPGSVMLETNSFRGPLSEQEFVDFTDWGKVLAPLDVSVDLSALPTRVGACYAQLICKPNGCYRLISSPKSLVCPRFVNPVLPSTVHRSYLSVAQRLRCPGGLADFMRHLHACLSGKLFCQTRGIPQGSCISADLANLFLANTDRTMLGQYCWALDSTRKALRKTNPRPSSPPVAVLRYFDDYLCLASSSEHLASLVYAVKQGLYAVGLRLNLDKEKTNIDSLNQPVMWLGVEIRRDLSLLLPNISPFPYQPVMWLGVEIRRDLSLLLPNISPFPLCSSRFKGYSRSVTSCITYLRRSLTQLFHFQFVCADRPRSHLQGRFSLRVGPLGSRSWKTHFVHHTNASRLGAYAADVFWNVAKSCPQRSSLFSRNNSRRLALILLLQFAAFLVEIWRINLARVSFLQRLAAYKGQLKWLFDWLQSPGQLITQSAGTANKETMESHTKERWAMEGCAKEWFAVESRAEEKGAEEGPTAIEPFLLDQGTGRINDLLAPGDINCNLDATARIAEDLAPDIWERNPVDKVLQDPVLELGEELVWVGLPGKDAVLLEVHDRLPACWRRYMTAARATQGIDERPNSRQKHSKIVAGMSEAVRLAALATVYTSLSNRPTMAAGWVPSSTASRYTFIRSSQRS